MKCLCTTFKLQIKKNNFNPVKDGIFANAVYYQQLNRPTNEK
jgi:hypothetical protein